MCIVGRGGPKTPTNTVKSQHELIELLTLPDLAQWADSSSDSDDHEDAGGEQTYEFELSNYDVENGSETWKCVNCGQPNVPYIRYCHRCWQERKGWVPERPKPKRGKNNRYKCYSFPTAQVTFTKSNKVHTIVCLQRLRFPAQFVMPFNTKVGCSRI